MHTNYGAVLTSAGSNGKHTLSWLSPVGEAVYEVWCLYGQSV